MKETDIDRLRSQWKNMDLTSEELDRHAREVADALARNRTVGAKQKLRPAFEGAWHLLLLVSVVAVCSQRAAFVGVVSGRLCGIFRRDGCAVLSAV